MSLKSSESIKLVKIMKWIMAFGLFFLVLEYIGEIFNLPRIGIWGNSGLLFLVVFPFLIIPLFAILGSAIADRAVLKGRSWKSFFWLSMIFSPLLMFIIVSAIQVDQSQLTIGSKMCPKCAEPVKQEAILCKHCGSSI